MKKEILIAFTACIILFFICFYVNIYLGLGKAESDHDPSSVWLYVNHSLLIVLAIVLPVFSGINIFRIAGWKFNSRWFAIAVAVGFFMGFGNRGGFDPRIPVMLLLALFHTFAMEFFFRTYLYRFLQPYFKWQYTSMVLSSLFHGIIYLTEYPIWQLSMVGKAGIVFLFTMLGILFSVSYKKSDSFYVPWFMHFFGVLKYGLLF